MSVISQSAFPPNEFWDFSIRVYGDADVAEACLLLQERHDVNVNVLLFCCWVAAGGRGVFEDGELDRALETVADWRQDVVLALRRARRYLKGSIGTAPRHLADQIRRVVKETEIHAEHIEQLMLADTMTRPATGSFGDDGQADDARANVAVYLDRLNVKLKEDEQAALDTILTQAFPPRTNAAPVTG